MILGISLVDFYALFAFARGMSRAWCCSLLCIACVIYVRDRKRYARPMASFASLVPTISGNPTYTNLMSYFLHTGFCRQKSFPRSLHDRFLALHRKQDGSI